MDIFTDDASTQASDEQEIERKAIAEAGGAVIGASAMQQQRQMAHSKKTEDQQRQQRFTALQVALLDPIYREAWERANAAINQTQSALDQAFADNEALMDDIDERAVKLEDGREVFIREDGRGQTKDGEIIPLSVMKTLDIPDNAATLDEYEKALRQRQKLTTHADHVHRVREEIHNPRKPAKTERLEEIEHSMKDIDRDLAGLPGASKNTAEPSISKTTWSIELDTTANQLVP